MTRIREEEEDYWICTRYTCKLHNNNVYAICNVQLHTMQCIAIFIKSLLKVWVTQSTKQNISENYNTNWPHYWHDLLSSTHPFKCRRPEKYCLRSYRGKYKTTRALLSIQWTDYHNMQYNRLQSVLKWGGMDGMIGMLFDLLVIFSVAFCLLASCEMLSHIVKSCPLTKLNGGLSRLHSADEDAVSWLTSYGSWHA